MFKLCMRILAPTALSLAATLAAPAQAARFANQFTEFELPPQWQCVLEGAEWVCQSVDENKKKDAIIVLAAKLKGEQDSLDQYLAYLKEPRQFTSIQGKLVKSEAKYTKTVKLGDQVWVDSLHLESEIPGFYTRYFATVKQDIGVLVTYSINQAKYKEYLSEFDAMVQTLKVFRKAGSINAKAKDSDIFNISPPTGIQPGTVFPAGGANPVGGEKDKPKSSGDDDFTFYLIVIAGAALLIFIIKKRRGR